MTISVTLEDIGCGYGDSLCIALPWSMTIDLGANGGMMPIFGETGQGKTTLLNVLSGFMPPSRGRVSWRIGNRAPVSWSAEQAISARHRKALGFGIARQGSDLPASFRIGETLSGLLRHRGFVRDEIPGLIDRAMTPFLVTPDAGEGAADGEERETVAALAAKFPSELSGGQRQRMSLACSICHNPDVLFLDEPTSNLDARTGQKVLHALARWLDEAPEGAPRALVMVTHDRNAPATIINAREAGEYRLQAAGLLNEWHVSKATFKGTDGPKGARMLEVLPCQVQ